jgi:hypothetical protein
MVSDFSLMILMIDRQNCGISKILEYFGLLCETNYLKNGLNLIIKSIFANS